MEEATVEAGKLFEGISVAAITGDALPEAESEKVLCALRDAGARIVDTRRHDRELQDLHAVTHIIAADTDFPQYNSAVEMGILVVKPSWVYQSVSRNKVAGARQHSPDPSQFFQGVILTCGNLPGGDKDAIIAGVMAMGGQYSGPLTKIVTHIVTTDGLDDKCKLAVAKNLPTKIVLPHWFDDCLRLGKKINERPYCFPNPPILQPTLARPANSNAPHLNGGVSAMPSESDLQTPPPTPSKLRKYLTAFKSKSVMLSGDLDINKRLRDLLGALIDQAGGKLTDNVQEADIYIGRYRDGADYIAASRARKEVANLTWLFHVINQNKYTNPLRKLLHYPVPRSGIKGFENLKISISNYNGDARTYLQNLVELCGAEFTKTMKQDNTHLITAHTRSEKYEAAQEWNINIINHLWLEESYAKAQYMSLSNPRYTHFPIGTNLGEVCGQTPLDMKRIESEYFPPPRTSPQKAKPSVAQAKPSPRKTLPSCGTPHRPGLVSDPVPMDQDSETESEAEQASPSARVLHGKASTAPAKSKIDPEAGGDAHEAPSTGKRPRGRPRRSLGTPKPVDDEKENLSPMVMTSGRAAKAKALEAVHAASDDMLRFAKEMKRKGGVLYGGRPSSHADDFTSPLAEARRSKKRKSDESMYEAAADGSDLSDGETQLAPQGKKAKTSTVPAVKFRMMITGDDRWVGKPKQESADQLKLRALGIELTQNPREVDILVAPGIKRTRKFLAALANAPLVVSTDYLDTALNENKIMSNPAVLDDPIGEKAFGIKLAEAIERAKINEHKLFRGWSIFVTKDTQGGFDTYKDIITVNGGDAYLYQGRTGLTFPKRRLRNDPESGSESQHQGDDDEFDYIYLVSSVSESDIKLWKTFRSQAQKQDLQARVVDKDWLLTAALSQQIQWNQKWELKEADLKQQRDR